MQQKLERNYLKATTGIGSLPHHNVDTALEYSFRLGIPFLPQIPIRNRWEFTIAQSLESTPGLFVEDDGSVFIREKVWEEMGREFVKKTNYDYTRLLQLVTVSDTSVESSLSFSYRYPSFSAVRELLEPYQPYPERLSCWQPFLWELQDRGTHLAKFQIAGPLTSYRSLRFRGEQSLESYPEFSQLISQLILLKACAMTFAFTSQGVNAILFIDEPALYSVDWTAPQSQQELRELRLMIEILKKLGAKVGVHCCSQMQWSHLMQLPLDYISLDCDLSLGALMHIQDGKALSHFIQGGGNLALGIIPSNKRADLQSLDLPLCARNLKEQLMTHEMGQRIFKDALFTPSCGLAFHSVSDAELVLQSLNRFYELCERV